MLENNIVVPSFKALNMTLAHDVHKQKRTQDIQISQDVTFDTMLLNTKTLQGLKSSGFYKPSPIQLHGIPLGKSGFDLLLEAKSGTGKTAVFSVIALEKMDLSKNLQVLMLAPTREIAAQICDVMKQIGSHYEGLQIEVVMGGLSVQDDITKFKNKVHVVVGSPGRLHHLIKDKHIDVSAVRLLVLDEADKLMEKSFEPDIKYIFNILPKQKQVIMSSATYPENTKTFINSYVQNAQHVCPDSNCVLLGVEQKICVVKYNSNVVRQTQNRFEELLKILTNIQFKQCLIFCNYQVRVTELHKLLTRRNWPSEQLYGQQEQTYRLDALKTLQEYKCRILISTDLAARGIDASNVDLVINFEPPYDWQTYLHRIGRAGRFGSYGMSITILSEGKEEEHLKKMLDPMKGSITLTPLWSNACLKNGDDCTLQSQKYTQNLLYTNKENECKVLWNILTTKDSQNEYELESFENLCNSFSNCSIESFVDLIESFKNTQYNIDDKNSEYKYISLINKSFKDMIPMKHVIHKKMNLLEKVMEPTDEENLELMFKNYKTTAEFYYETNNTKNSLVDTLSQCKNSKICNGTGKQYKLCNRKNDRSKRQEKNKNIDKDSVAVNDNGNFGYDIYENNSYAKLNGTITTANKTEYNNNKYYKTKSNYSENQKRTSSLPRKVFEYCSDYADDEIKYNESDNRRMKNNQWDNNIFCEYASNKHTLNYDKHGSSKTESANKSINLRNSYVIWYKQLKLRMKQIEIATYIHELSKN